MKSASLTIKSVPLADVQPHEKNPRNHPEPGSEEWELLRLSLADSYFDPLVFNERNGKLVSGHLRRKVMLSEGYTHADCVIVDWDEGRHLARMIAANHGMGEDDEEGLRLILGELEESDVELRLAGLIESDLSGILSVVEAPGSFPEVNEDIATEHRCPKCGYQWSGKPGGGEGE